MPRKPREAPRDEILSQKQLAARLDLDPRQVRNLVKRGMPATYLRETGSERGYPWPACFHWYVQFKVDVETAKFSQPARLLAAQVREVEARAAKREHELALARASVLPIDWIAGRERRLLEQVHTEFRTFGQRIRHDLVQLPDVAAVDRILGQRIDEALIAVRTALLAGADAELSAVELPPEDEDPEDPDAADDAAA